MDTKEPQLGLSLREDGAWAVAVKEGPERREITEVRLDLGQLDFDATLSDLGVTPDLCKHGGVILNDITYCGYCNASTGVAAAHILYTELERISKQEARRFCLIGAHLAFEDLEQQAFMAVWSKLAKIVTAKNPPALARIIARQAVFDIKKVADNVRLIPVSDGSEPDGDKSGHAIVSSVSRDENGDEDSGGDNGWLESEHLLVTYQGGRIQNKDHGANNGLIAGPGQVGVRDWNIPGGDRFWVPVVYLKLESALAKSLAALPRPPKDKVPMAVDMMIKLWVGYFEESGPHTYEMIGKLCDPVTSARRVKYLIQKGIKQARRHILQQLG